MNIEQVRCVLEDPEVCNLEYGRGTIADVHNQLEENLKDLRAVFNANFLNNR